MAMGIMAVPVGCNCWVQVLGSPVGCRLDKKGGLGSGISFLCYRSIKESEGIRAGVSVKHGIKNSVLSLYLSPRPDLALYLLCIHHSPSDSLN